jgi:choline kinase
MLSRPGVTLHLNVNFETTSTVHSLFCAKDALRGSEDVVVSHGDIVFEPSVLEGPTALDASVALEADTDWLRYW